MRKRFGNEFRRFGIIGAVLLLLVIALAGCSPESDSRAYTNVYFDYSDQIAAVDAKSTAFTSPVEDTKSGLSVSDENDATGVVLVAAQNPENKNDLYLNALVAGNELVFSGSGIVSVTDAVGSNPAVIVSVSEDSFTVKPAIINADEPVDEVIGVTMSDGNTYNIHTVNELLPGIDIAKSEVEAVESGVYSILVDRFLLRVDTDGNLVYYRNLDCTGENIVENFQAQDTEEGRFYTFMVELDPSLRNAMGGFSSGMYVLMDENYNEINYITLMANDDKNHTHGEGYLDQHEFVLLGENHWIGLSYTQEFVDNLTVAGIDGGSTAYIQAGIIQEVKDGKVIHEYNTADYPELYASAKEACDYGNSTNNGTADDYMDYVHVNSICIDPKDDNLLVSMRNQYAVYKFDRENGNIIWALGGDNNQFTGLEDYLDDNGNLFVGQHYARYVDESIAGNDSTVTVFNNNTNYQQNATKTYTFTLDEENKTATVSAVEGTALDAITGKMHWATHCGSYQQISEESSLMGWGFCAALDMNPATINQHALLTDYNPTTGNIGYELSVSRNSLYKHPNEACFSYRAYKNND
ncbi:arylsulfotransferase family protein [Eubacteriaceae bacterium ES2]|nr:arylsulfotransferase family protein [Eubacteriaceae bacterium ES2]